ncbi:uncharacterized protein BXZ73DRAFT_89957 [Epithele typhae]|uniref:uncharacterized protein n=1 Tax=Epithele typhae TaxID=378194 RepID=UPI002007A1BC|nr:uncharacterized protein BXZ73DRAFT_89957 [Epithele typhae]KAH9931996.1 hypothetical protein BXZ73DRAFT_89957 [Epithele typhae]
MPQDPLFEILRAYATLKPTKAIHRPCYPPSRQYQRSFWKWAIDWLERLDELDERLYTHQIELMQVPTPQHVFPEYASVTLVESRTTIEAGTTGLRTWSAGLVLPNICCPSPLVAGKRVMELGCGAGFLGAIVASIQLAASGDSPISLWLTDVHEPVLQRCEVNVRLPCNASHRHPDMTVLRLDWSDAQDPDRSGPIDDLANVRATPDIVLGADLVYEPSIIPPLVAVLDATLSPGRDRIALIALTLRNEDTMSDFLRQASEWRPVGQYFTGAAELGQDASEQVRMYKRA